MRRLIILSCFAILFASAGAQVSKGIPDAEKGTFSLGLMIGVPPVDHAKMPTISLDASWGILSGFINTKTFGSNGAVDLGAYYGFTAYGESGWNTVQNAIVFRPAFHFQFIKKLDTYAGVLAGVNLWHTSIDGGDSNSDANAVFGIFTGAKYYFSDKFGVKLEFADDFAEGDIPVAAAGICFKF